MKKNGYTLIELIVTIGLIATAATVILLNVVGMKSNQDEDNSKRFKKAIEDAACSYIDMSETEIMELRNHCKSSSDNRCNIPLSKLLDDKYALVDIDLKDPETNCTAEKEKDKIYVKIDFGSGTIKEKKCTFVRTSKEMCKSEE